MESSSSANTGYRHIADYYSQQAAVNTDSQALFSSPASSNFSAGPYYVDALVNNLSWSGDTDTAAVVTYTFSIPASGGVRFNSTQQTSALNAMAEFERVADVDFRSTTSTSPDVVFGEDELGSGTDGLASYQFTGTQLVNADVYVDEELSDFAVGGYGYTVILHEVGHALGLKHPGNYGPDDEAPFLTGNEEDIDTTVMSYNDGTFANASRWPQSLMIYDIAAAQFLYGANNSYNNTATEYDYSAGSNLAYTIWDGGGSDTLSGDASASTLTLDLREGADFVSTLGNSRIWIAFGADIENAAGGLAGDLIYGNDLANGLSGGGGNDVMSGNEGSDSVSGNLGNDTLQGNAGSDSLRGGQGNDSIRGGQDADSVLGDRGFDTTLGDRGNDLIFGGQDDDALFGGQDQDFLSGDLGGDTLSGDLGNDTLTGGAGNDFYRFNSSSGVDIITDFTIGQDKISLLSNLNGSGITSAALALTQASYSGGTAILALGGGNSVTIQGITSGLSASDFVIT
jgi:serralysin